MPRKSEEQLAEDLQAARQEAKAVYGKKDPIQVINKKQAKSSKKIAIWGVIFIFFVVIALVWALFN